MATNFINYYKILQVDPEAETDVIEGAFRRLALKYHPDVNKASDADEKMKLINEARKVLTNPQERHKYDQLFRQNIPSQPSPSSSWKQETADDVWDEKSTRNLASQILMIAQHALNKKKWRIAKEKLYAFEGLGVSSNEGPLPTFPSSLPEWQDAKRLNELANQQANAFRSRLRTMSLGFYCFALGITGFIMMMGNYFYVNNNNEIAFSGSDITVGIVVLGGGIGAFLGILAGLLVGLIGSSVYSHWYAGKWGEGTDNLVGVLTPIIIALVISFGIYFILVYALFNGVFSSSKKRK